MTEYIKTLIIDNYDSYTFNLLQLFSSNCPVVVIRNDQFTWEGFVVDVLPHFDNIIISPGPGRPERSSDFGICTQLLQAQLDPNQSEYHRPIFGVCLGYQGIGHIFGGKVIHAPRIMHGRMSKIHVEKNMGIEYNDLLSNCPSPFWAVRYHSLIVEKDSLPKDLLITGYCYENDADMEALKHSKFLADSQDAEKDVRNHFLDHSIIDKQNNQITVMAFQHKYLPIWGVQFHPESVSTEHGEKMISNFQNETYHWMIKKGRSISKQLLDASILSYSVALPKLNEEIKQNQSKFELIMKSSCINWIEPELFVDELLLQEKSYKMSWLDSSRTNSPYSRMSVLSIDPAIQFSYSTLHKELCIETRNEKEKIIKNLETTFFDYISNLLTECGKVNTSNNMDFEGGLVGYFGYEMKRESMEGYIIPEQQKCQCKSHGIIKNCCRCVEEPDSAFQFVDRFLMFDLIKQQIYICCLVQKPTTMKQKDILNNVGFKSTKDALDWIEKEEKEILNIIEKRKLIHEFISLTPNSSTTSLPIINSNNNISGELFKPDVNHQDYLNTIQKCVDSIKEGESYEICLTTRFRLNLPKHISTHDSNLWRLYTRYLRRNNPAPFSALLMFPQVGLLCSSPERFLKIKNGIAEMKPIKGTVARVLQCVCKDNCKGGNICKETKLKLDEERQQQLWQDVKERAENLMIVDLIRNDLAQVCDPSSVQVPKLMHVETYEKVHHLVSTVRGKLQSGVNSVEALQKCFPPGSMTGAPKLRSVQILDELENHQPRGIYSGCLGYFSLNGSADFNVVIRTAIASTKSNGLVEVSVGGGGAITFLSDPEQEWKETLLKTKSVAPSVKEFLEDQL